MSFTVVTYNVLADAYIRTSYFPNTPAAVLEPARRRAALLARLQQLSPDVLCLQELEASKFALVQEALPEYRGEYAQKAQRKPDGCGTFVRGAVESSERFEYQDGTGHIALLVILTIEGRRLGVANTHLRFDSHDGQPGIGAAQLHKLLAHLPLCDGWVVCGDFNALPDSHAVRAALDAGWLDACASAPAPTCNANAWAKRIDFLLHTAGLRAEPHPLPAIQNDTALPSEQEPSDHLPVRVSFTWTQG